jgi:hypothetical protein
MTFDGVTVDHGGVTGLERRRHAEAAFDFTHFLDVLDHHGEAVGLEMLDPVFAATAGW